ncbi:MAG: hypothetical protein CMM93_05745 [Rickettsiales bacterium]|nr:hypothetical protein [Rickettsiales bacterium]
MTDGPTNNIPSVTGKIIEETSKSGIISNLFGPITKDIGQEWAESRRKKRSENLNAHVEAVKTEINSSGLNSPTDKQVLLIEKWSDSAQDVGDDDESLAAIWRALLEKVASDDSESEMLIKISADLTSDEAKVMFLLLEDRYSVDEGPARKSLMAKGLIQKNDVHTPLFLSAILITLMLSLLYYLFFGQFDISDEQQTEATGLVYFIVLTIILYALLMMMLSVNAYVHTETGKNLMKIARKYQCHNYGTKRKKILDFSQFFKMLIRKSKRLIT